MRKFLIILLILILLFFVYCFFIKKGGCCFGPSAAVIPCDTCTKTVEHWLSWNLLFATGKLKTSDTAITDLENYLSDYVKSKNPSATLTFQLQYCPCDSLLTNMDATLVYGSGNTVPQPPTQPRPIPNGDYTLGDNLNMSIPSYLDSNRYMPPQKSYDSLIQVVSNPKLPGTNLGPRHKVLAVIDTGLDTALFKLSYPKTIWNGNLLWQDASKATLFDVVLGESTGSLMDGVALNVDNHVKHGTAVTQIVLTQIYNHNRSQIPEIMSIRAFDDSERGSIYTVSCALSYAIQHKADYVNASWGYYGKVDSVLKHYVRKASDSSVRIIAAAGNTPGKHDPNLVCTISNTVAPIPNPANNLDMLKQLDTLFYPACFAPDIKNLVSVTQLDQVNIPPSKLQLIPCYYQNYSSNYITIGAFEQIGPGSKCCVFNIPFLVNPVEGSSFATPAMTALFMYRMVGDMDIKSWVRANAKHDPLSIQYTDAGSYFPFKPLP